MVKYIFNNNIHGYEKSNINDFDINSVEKDSLVVVIIDKSCDEVLDKYYKMIRMALSIGSKIIAIGIKDGNKSFKVIASLMVMYNSYNIYEVDGKEDIRAKELLMMESREPDLSEVQAYIGGDVTAYADIDTILYGISSLVDEGSEDRIKGFLEEHLLSIENLVSTLNTMKKTCDIFNSNELIDTINDLKLKEAELNKEIESKNKEIKDVKLNRDEYKVKAETLKRDMDKLKTRADDLESQSKSGGSVIKEYKEVSTQLIQCKAKIIVYFKEISYVPYVNTLIKTLLEKWTMKKLKTKLLIYDSRVNLYDTYKPLNIVSGETYITRKSDLVNKTHQFVVSEPNPTILQDVLTCEQIFDVVVIYDRLKGSNDLVSGNNVTKFFVINSKKDYEAVKSKLKITSNKYVITQPYSRIDDGGEKLFLDIPYLKDFVNGTDAAKTSKYLKLKTAHSGVPLVEEIEERARVSSLIKK